MKKFVIFVIVAAVAVAGFYWYTQSGSEIDEALPEIMQGVNLDEAMSEEEVLMMMEEIEATEETETEEAMPEMSDEPMADLRGNFTEVDFIHKGSGLARIIPNAVGGPVLRLEDFEVTNGPDLFVYLSKNTDIKSNGLGEFTEVARLKASKGNQNYVIDENYEDYKSVVIWCKAFGVLFSYAELE